jgi:predicted ATPase/DNA-binding XRE family transcriptional regulator
MGEDEESGIISFGYWVQQRRNTLDLTRPELAQRVSCSPVTIKKIERDERRPSRQIAALLADQLVIPDEDRDKFIRMARGEFVASSMSSPNLVSLPGFLRTPDEAEKWVEATCVAREDELARLNTYLNAALAGSGGVVFITGEAGNGKTLLAQEFAWQAQKRHPNLVIANGNCNAHIGIGDPYLPFREILALLTGDIESRWVSGEMSRTSAQRLWGTVPYTVKALVEVGPDLVDTFVSGSQLVNRATAAAPGSRNTLAQLKSLVARHQTTSSPAHLRQSDLFTQYTRVLHRIARQKPMLLIMDDLQWADAGSIGLLFHLSRMLEGQRILMVGLYRPADLTLGRPSTSSGEWERHPLEPVVSELQRSFGDSQVVLGQNGGRSFIEALLDTELNRLGKGFREALHRRTGGHPLFTVEMLRGMQARGDLVQDEQGYWVEGPVLNWKTLPARVEAVISERISRLPPLLQEVLKVASVEGELFTAEVVARVQGSDDLQMVSWLSSVLDRQQRLVKIQGSQLYGKKQITQYRFRHILFQQYLYDSLDQVERVYFHRAVGNKLEQIYGEQADSIAPQLARHYAMGGDDQGALKYFAMAGDMAAAVYANTEAEAHYRRALEIAKSLQAGLDKQARDQHIQLYLQLGRTLELNAQYDQALDNYEDMETLALERGDPAMILASLLARAAIRTTVNFARDPVKGKILLEKARALARDLDDRSTEAKILWNLLILNAYTGGDLHQRLEYGEQALALVRELDLKEQMALTLHDLYYAYAGADQWRLARNALKEASELWRELGNLPMLSETLMRIHGTYLATGDYEQAIAFSDEAFHLGQESNNLDAQALSRFLIGFVFFEQGQPDQALTIMTETVDVAESVASLTPLASTRAELGWVYGQLGAIDRGLELAHLARSTAEEKLPILQSWPRAILVSLHLLKGDLAAAETIIRTLEDYHEVKYRFGYMPFMWVRVALAKGEFALSQQDFMRAAELMDELYTDLRQTGIRYLLPDVLHLKGQALFEQGSINAEEAYETLIHARAEAEALGSRRALWPILCTLAEIEQQRGHLAKAEALRKQAQEIVDYITHHIGVPEFRASFLNLPNVKAALSA